MRAAVYARFSSENQREQSIEDQIRVCQEFAKRDGITVLENHIVDFKLPGRSAIDLLVVHDVARAIRMIGRLAFDFLLQNGPACVDLSRASPIRLLRGDTRAERPRGHADRQFPFALECPRTRRRSLRARRRCDSDR